MTTDFAAAMRRATGLTRAFDLSGATKVIQEALAGKPTSATAPLDLPTLTPPQHTAPEPSTPKTLGSRILRPLSEVVRTLKEGRATVLYAPQARRPAPAVPAGAQFVARSFTGRDGSRQFKLFIPEAAPRGLIVMLHGCKQNPDDFAVGTKMNEVAARNNLLVAYPSQTNSANAGGCWNWFAPAHQMRDRGEPSILAGMTRELMHEFGLEREQVFVAGLSAGGAMAAVMLETYPDLFSGAGIHSGLAYRSANDVMSAFAAMRGDATRVAVGATVKHPYSARVIIFHGDADSTVHPRNARRILTERVDPNWAVIKAMGETNGQKFVQEVFTHGDNVVELWSVTGAGHAWSGGDPLGSYASANGPNASSEIVRFFLA